MAQDQTNGMIVRDDVQNEGHESTDEEPSISKDDLFHVLQNERRRRVLKYVATNCDGPFEMRTIAEHVAADEHDTTVQALTSDQRQRVYIALYQSHLPKLDQQGFIDYNQSRGVVEKRPLVEETVEHLDDVAESSQSTTDVSEDTPTDDHTSEQTVDAEAFSVPDTWRKSFAGATAGSLLLLSAAWTNVSGALSGIVVTTLVVALFAALSIGMIYRSE